MQSHIPMKHKDLNVGVKTVWNLSDKNEVNKLRAVDEIPNQCCKQWVKILRSIVSKTAERSRRRAVERPSSSETRISFCTYKSTVSEEWYYG